MSKRWDEFDWQGHLAVAFAVFLVIFYIFVCIVESRR